MFTSAGLSVITSEAIAKAREEKKLPDSKDLPSVLVRDKPWLIGLAGRKSSGKGTAAIVFTEGYNFQEFNFADPLKRGVAIMFGWTIDSMYDPELKEVIDPILGFSRRIAMQKVGTEGVRDGIGKDTWVNIMRKRLDGDFSRDRVVIADIRMENEAAMVREMGGVVVHCLRPNSSTEDLHESERGPVIYPQDLQVNNNYGVEEYINNVHAMAKCFGYF